MRDTTHVAKALLKDLKGALAEYRFKGRRT